MGGGGEGLQVFLLLSLDNGFTPLYLPLSLFLPLSDSVPFSVPLRYMNRITAHLSAKTN
jgi:hypothetical protein